MKNKYLSIGIFTILSAGLALVSCKGKSNTESSMNSSEISSNIPTSETSEEKFCTVTFRQENVEDIVKSVKYGEALIDIPTPNSKTGYIATWDVTDFSNIVEDIIVNAILTAKTYTLNLDPNGGTVSNNSVTVTYDQPYALEKAVHEENLFISWKYNEQVIPLTGVWNIDVDESITLVAEWGGSAWTDIH